MVTKELKHSLPSCWTMLAVPLEEILNLDTQPTALRQNEVSYATFHTVLWSASTE